MRKLSIGRAVRVALFGVTLVLAAVSAFAVAGIFDARQDYEDALADSYELQISAGRLLTAGVLEAAVLERTGERAARARELAQGAFEEEAGTAQKLAESDPESARIIRQRIRAQERARRAAGSDAAPNAPDDLGSALLTARQLSQSLSARQAERRDEARDEASDQTRRSVIIAIVAGFGALVGAMVLIALLVASMRRPLDELVGATGALAEGDLERRVKPSGPKELRELGSAFNTMASELDTAQQRLAEERHKLAVTIESLGDALVVCSADGAVTSLNPRAADLVPELALGGPSQGEGSPLPDLELALEQEVVLVHNDRTLSVTASELSGTDEGVVWTIRDISERAQLEQLKTEFVATASHELRSPLTSIKGFIELLANSEGLDEKQREFVDVILLSTNRLVDLVNDLLDVARVEAGQIEIHTRATDAVEAVREVATLIEPRIVDKGQELELQLPRLLPLAMADPARLRQVITNLITNAHLYTPPGGHITVRLDAEEHAIVLRVTDTGRGMTQEEQEHIFDRFYRGADGRTVPGTGLGLSIVRSLVDLHGGSIEVESELDRGSVFIVRIPRLAIDEEGPLPREALRGRRVLIVDDEPEIAELIAVHLEPYEVETTVVHSGAEALELLRNERFDAMTLDILMPGMSGFEVLEAVRSDPVLKRTSIVFVSVYSGREALAGEWTVAKPIDAEQLTDALGSAVLAGRTRVLVVGRTAVKPRLQPALDRIGLDHDWVTSGTSAARVCQEHRYEVALVDAGVRSPQAVLQALDLRGRRLGRAVILFTAGGEDEGIIATLAAEPVPVEEAAAAVLQVLSETAAG
jgi:signal transduction histidine kinase/DNA-binding response OmpR family regulator